MAKTNEALNAAVKLAPYIARLGSYIDNKITRAEQKAAAKLFQAVIDEIYHNLAAISNLKLAAIKPLKINSPQLKRIAEKDLQTKYEHKSKIYIEKFPQLKGKDTKRILDRITSAEHKIDDLRANAAKSDKELKLCKHFRPAVRLKNIHNIYLEINSLLK